MATTRGAKTRAGQKWTEARFFAFIRSALRRAWSRYPVRFDALKSSRRAYSGPNTRQKWEFRCSACQKWHMAKEVQVDHITPCGPLNSFDDLPGFVKRLFPEKEGLAILCKPCHKTKTQNERNMK